MWCLFYCWVSPCPFNWCYILYSRAASRGEREQVLHFPRRAHFDTQQQQYQQLRPVYSPNISRISARAKRHRKQREKEWLVWHKHRKVYYIAGVRIYTHSNFHRKYKRVKRAHNCGENISIKNTTYIVSFIIFVCVASSERTLGEKDVMYPDLSQRSKTAKIKR